MNCKKHPSYAGKGIPTSDCRECMDVYVEKHPQLKKYIEDRVADALQDEREARACGVKPEH